MQSERLSLRRFKIWSFSNRQQVLVELFHCHVLLASIAFTACRHYVFRCKSSIFRGWDLMFHFKVINWLSTIKARVVILFQDLLPLVGGQGAFQSFYAVATSLFINSLSRFICFSVLNCILFQFFGILPVITVVIFSAPFFPFLRLRAASVIFSIAFFVVSASFPFLPCSSGFYLWALFIFSHIARSTDSLRVVPSRLSALGTNNHTFFSFWNSFLTTDESGIAVLTQSASVNLFQLTTICTNLRFCHGNIINYKGALVK